MDNRYFFASANTSLGFINYFDNILDKNKKGFTYIIKGSSGCGKSTLLKKIAKYFENKGKTIEYYYCSSDPNSLDAVKIVEYNICLLDGTSPHSTDTKMPEIYDKIINLGEFINISVNKHYSEITSILETKKSNYEKIYNYLNAIGKLEEINRKNYFDYYNLDLEKQVLSLCSKSFKQSQTRKLFISALDVFGINDFTSKNNLKVITLSINKYQFAYFADKIISKLKEKGIDLILFYDIYSPNCINSILLNNKILVTYDKNFNYNNFELKTLKIINSLQKLASKTLKDTRKLHFKLEKFYNKHIDFINLSKIYDKLILDIEKRI